jgi:tRNA/tmRNA/rRNA uracil-C5-methylase (TrmA/RlmC/RlmD family)
MTDSQRDYDDQNALLVTAQLEKLRLENERLKLELEGQGKGNALSSLIPYLPLITVMVTIAGFGFGVYQYREQQQANRVAQAEQSLKDREARETQSRKDSETTQREFMKPLLQNQLSLYLQASAAAATIARSTDPVERKKAINDFWRLYEGPLIIVESKDVSSAMVQFGNCLEFPESCDEGEIRKRAHAIASRMQESVLKSWNTNPENFAADKFIYR